MELQFLICQTTQLLVSCFFVFCVAAEEFIKYGFDLNRIIFPWKYLFVENILKFIEDWWNFIEEDENHRKKELEHKVVFLIDSYTMEICCYITTIILIFKIFWNSSPNQPTNPFLQQFIYTLYIVITVIL